MLYKGVSNSHELVKLQLQLRSLGYYNGMIDGIFGADLDHSVRMMQSKTGLVVDGIVGSKTGGKLDAITRSDWFVLFLHCAASPEGVHFTGDTIALMHTLPVEKGGRGWSRPGYSDVIELDGKLVNIRGWDQDDNIAEWEYTFGVKFNTLMNRNARHICYIGGVERYNLNAVKDTRTEAQKQTMRTYIEFCLLRNPKLIIAGHNQVQSKGCPSFDVPDYLRSIGIPEYNIANWGRLPG